MAATTPTPIPVRASVRDLLTDLLGCTVKVADGEPQSLVAGRPALLAVYRRDDDTVAAACVCDQDFAIRAGAAIGKLSLADATPEDPAKGPQGDVLEHFHEVVNALAKLLNTPTAPHVSLGEVLRAPGQVPGDVAALVSQPSQRADYQVHLDGFGDGCITLLSR